MRLLHVISSIDPRGGGPIEGVVSSADVWRKHGHECDILTLDALDDAWVAKSTSPIFAVGLNGRAYRAIRRAFPWLRYGYTPKLTSWLRENARNYDAVILNGLWNYASWGSWRALRRLETPYFVYTHGMLDPWFNKAYPTKSLFKAIFWKLLENKVLRDARGVLFTCEAERELASRSFSPYAAREFVAGHGARDVEGDAEAQRAAFAARFAALRDRKFILFLGRLHPKKGIDLLIRAFARHAAVFPDFDLVVAGPDQTSMESDLRRLARDLGVADRMHWPGMLSGDAKWGAFRLARFFALPSHQENFGIAVAESLAVATPVLITHKVNVWREIEADGAGVVVSDDVEGVAVGLYRMCALLDGERDLMARRGRDSFLKRYDIEPNAMNLLALIAAETKPRALEREGRPASIDPLVENQS